MVSAPLSLLCIYEALIKYHMLCRDGMRSLKLQWEDLLIMRCEREEFMSIALVEKAGQMENSG